MRLSRLPDQERYLAQFKGNASSFVEGQLLAGLTDSQKRAISIEAAQLNDAA